MKIFHRKTRGMDYAEQLEGIGPLLHVHNNNSMGRFGKLIGQRELPALLKQKAPY